VSDHDIAVAAAARPDQAAPITRAFRGTGVSSRMRAEIRMGIAGGGGP
jgi:hypothetical protein